MHLSRLYLVILNLIKKKKDKFDENGVEPMIFDFQSLMLPSMLMKRTLDSFG